MNGTTKSPASAPLLDFRLMALAVAAVLALAVNASDARQRGALRSLFGGLVAGRVPRSRTGHHRGHRAPLRRAVKRFDRHAASW